METATSKKLSVNIFSIQEDISSQKSLSLSLIISYLFFWLLPIGEKVPIETYRAHVQRYAQLWKDKTP